MAQILREGIEIQDENHLSMSFIVNLDVMMAKRKMSLNDLSEKVDITLSKLSILKSKSRPLQHFGSHMQGIGMSTRGYIGV